MQFTESIEIAFNLITVRGANREAVGQVKLRQLAAASVPFDFQPLKPGNYIIEWRVLSVDTHITEGTLRFTVYSSGR
jgi:methionine-rich copper-binding protein CopC